MFARIAVAVPVGAAVTATLLLLMHFLIESGDGMTDREASRVAEFVRVERVEEIPAERERPERPAPPERAPELPQPETGADYSTSLTVAMAEPRLDASMDVASFGVGGDGEYLPIVKVAPVYPLRALQRRIEGYVIVEFVVTAVGGVRDVTVVESSSPIFEEAAIEAALRFKYKPRVLDGQPIEVPGVQNRITFRLKA